MDGVGQGFWQHLEEYPVVEQINIVGALMRMSPTVETSIVNSPEFTEWLSKNWLAATEWGRFKGNDKEKENERA